MPELGPRTTELSDLLPILRAAWLDAFCDRWHLDRRATPPLKAIAGDVGDAALLEAAEHTTAAAEHLDAAVAELRKAVALVEDRVPADGQVGLRP